MKAVWVAAMLVAATVTGVASPARAGVIGDAVVSAGGWVAKVETAVSGWFDRVWGRVVATGQADRTAEAVRQLAVTAPERLDAVAKRAGYALSSYVVARDGSRDLVLWFRHSRDIATDERQTLKRELTDESMLDIRPELALLRILLDANDWRDTGISDRYRLTGVQVQVDDTMSSKLIFSEPGVTR